MEPAIPVLTLVAFLAAWALFLYKSGIGEFGNWGPGEYVGTGQALAPSEE